MNIPLLLRPGAVASPDNGASGVQAGSMGRPPPVVVWGNEANARRPIPFRFHCCVVSLLLPVDEDGGCVFDGGNISKSLQAV